jgi:hypothetical protein
MNDAEFWATFMLGAQMGYLFAMVSVLIALVLNKHRCAAKR